MISRCLPSLTENNEQKKEQLEKRKELAEFFLQDSIYDNFSEQATTEEEEEEEEETFTKVPEELLPSWFKIN